jgi:type I restriction enzyme S subunit
MGGRRLADVVTIVMGQSPPGETCATDGRGVALINGPTEFGAHHPVPVQYTTDARKLAAEGDLLFCVRGSTTGRMNWADQHYAIGRGVAALRHCSEPALQPLVRGVVECQLVALLAQATGSTFPNVSASQLSRLWWPSLHESEQRAIAHILGTLDDKIELNRRMCETLEEMARALFKSWFVDFDPVRARMEGRDTGLPREIADIFPDRLVESELGEIPEGWRVGCVGDVADALRDTVNPLACPDKLFVHHSIPAYDDGRRPVTEAGAEIKSAKTRVSEGSVLVSKLNPATQRVWLVDVLADDTAVCSTEFVVLLARAPYDRSFVYSAACAEPTLAQLRGMVTGTSGSHQRVPLEALMRLPLVLPPARCARAFKGLAEPLHVRALACRRESRTLAALRDTLLPKLISGEVRVGDAERFLAG